MSVHLKPSAGEEGRRYPTAQELAESLSALGLRPPSLTARVLEEGGQASESVLFRKLSAVATSVVADVNPESQEDVLRLTSAARPGKHPTTYGDIAKDHLNDDPDEEMVVALSSYALPVLLRMPTRNAEDYERRKLAAESLSYASVVTPTRSQFVVSAENQSAVTFRLHNQLIESLRQGCEDLLYLLSKPVEIPAGTITFELQGRIEIYEVGQEDSTISGQLIGFNKRDRLRHLLKTELVGILVFAILLTAFAALLVFLLLEHGQGPDPVAVERIRGHGQQFIPPDTFWLGQAERLQSGVLPVLLVTGLTLLVKYPRGERVRWSQVLRPDSKSVAS